jgi:hypothetical protein
VKGRQLARGIHILLSMEKTTGQENKRKASRQGELTSCQAQSNVWDKLEELFGVGNADEDNNKDRNEGKGKEHTVPTKNLEG